MRANLDHPAEQVIDARAPTRFRGDEPEHRPGVAPGHIPGSRNLPYARLFHDDGTWKRGPALAAEFRAAGIDVDRPKIGRAKDRTPVTNAHRVCRLLLEQ